MISTHVLDTSLGHPAQGIPVELAIFEGKQEDTKKAESETRHWRVIQSDVTNDDGRISFKLKIILNSSSCRLFLWWCRSFSVFLIPVEDTMCLFYLIRLATTPTGEVKWLLIPNRLFLK